MRLFKKRPIPIEAFQMTFARRSDNSEWPSWLNEAWNKEMPSEGSVWPYDYPDSEGNDKLCIGTLEGAHVVEWNDWIIQGIKGELYACKPDIFELSYEEII
jgi:hypothetical protein